MGGGSGCKQSHVPKQIQDGERPEASRAHDIGVLNIGLNGLVLGGRMSGYTSKRWMWQIYGVLRCAECECRETWE